MGPTFLQTERLQWKEKEINEQHNPHVRTTLLETVINAAEKHIYTGVQLWKFYLGHAFLPLERRIE